MFEIKEYPEFSWSNSRHKVFNECKRKYYYHYYHSHNGWLTQADEDTKLTYRLKNLKNLPILLGEAIHEVIYDQFTSFFAGEQLLEKIEVKEKVRSKLNRAFIDSKKHLNEWLMKPKRYSMLHEIYYNNELDFDEISTTKEKMELCIEQLFNSKTYNNILSSRTIQILEAEELKSFYFDEIKVYAVLDFVYRDRNTGNWVIIDWKTGKETDADREQLSLYALYLMDRYQINIEDITIQNVYLQTGHTQTYILNETDLVRARNSIIQSAELMQQLLIDTKQNQPLAEKYFEPTYSYRCKTCNFKQKCKIDPE